MKFKTKIYLILTGLTFGISLLGMGIVYLEVEKQVFNELRSKVLTIAATAAQTIDGDLLAQIENRSSVSSPSFEKIVKQMRAIEMANRRDDIYAIYIYTIRPDPQNKNQLLVGVDASEDPNVFAYPGDPYPEGAEIGIAEHLNEVWAPEKMISDRWGEFLAGYAPIRRSDGQYVGTIGVNLSAHYVVEELDRIKTFIFSTLALSLIAALIASTFLAHSISSSLEEISETVQSIGHGNLKARIAKVGTDEFGQLGKAINDMARGLEENQKLKLNFVRYVSKHVMEKILSADVVPGLQGERKKITVLFSDIRDFTRLAEKYPPEKVVSLLNEYLDKMLDVIFKRNGTLDKFIGDGLMVEFGAPLEDEAQEKHAIETALEMQKTLKGLNEKWKKEGNPVLEMGIGVHTGLAVVGNIGSEKRMEYTAIGDTVNVASRLEHATKDLKVPILISETTKSGIEGIYQTVDLGPISLPGREKPITVYTIV